MSKTEKGNNSVKFEKQNSMKSQSGYLHNVPKLYAWYHDPSSCGSPDILFTRLVYYPKCQSRKREIIQSNSFGILPKLNRLTTSWTQSVSQICIMNLAQEVLEIFCSQRFIGWQWKSRKNVEKWHNSRTKNLTEQENIRVRLFFKFIPHIKFQDSISNRSCPYASVTDARTYRQTTNWPKPICPPQLLRSWGQKTILSNLLK